MQLLINNQQAIIGYVTVGSADQGIEYTGTLPDGFEENFKPSFYLFQNGTIIANPNYVTPVEPTPDSRPTSEQEALTAIAQQMADQQQHIASLEQALTALAQGGAKS
ncbi:DUF2977 domain-containing protein [Lactiplantibacillus plantarum]|uniref:DUF2977 domain-containing protein n=1 Tax=Lactiplantibacillus plantarum TaxID=1590 RepID=UPI0006AD7D8C|nr:DUF2977 domain-containing protein [Lactiplantibacillus plantarum]ALC09303.1 prophage P1 protein 56 [Lactiplantibacillus plantarum]